MADRLQLEGANPYRIRAYRRAAENINRTKDSVVNLANEGRLREISGIGKDLEERIYQLLAVTPVQDPNEPGSNPDCERFDGLQLPGLDPRTAKILRKRFHLESLRDLELLARSRYLRTIPEFGARLERIILEGLDQMRK